LLKEIEVLNKYYVNFELDSGRILIWIHRIYMCRVKFLWCWGIPLW